MGVAEHARARVTVGDVCMGKWQSVQEVACGQGKLEERSCRYARFRFLRRQASHTIDIFFDLIFVKKEKGWAHATHGNGIKKHLSIGRAASCS